MKTSVGYNHTHTHLSRSQHIYMRKAYNGMRMGYDE